MVIVWATADPGFDAFRFVPRPVAGWTLSHSRAAAASDAHDGGGARNVDAAPPFDHARALVISGPYAYIRNPMAVFGLAQGPACRCSLDPGSRRLRRHRRRDRTGWCGRSRKRNLGATSGRRTSTIAGTCAVGSRGARVTSGLESSVLGLESVVLRYPRRKTQDRRLECA